MAIHALKNLDDTKSFAQNLAASLIEAKEDTILLFNGAMGSGKTTLIRELGLALGIQEKITSPTFIGMNEYHLDDLSFYHYDLYQVAIDHESIAEILEEQKHKIIAIEWAGNLDPQLLKLLELKSKLLELTIKMESPTRLLEFKKLCY